MPREVCLRTTDLAMTSKKVRAAKGRILHRLPEGLLIVELPDDADVSAFKSAARSSTMPAIGASPSLATRTATTDLVEAAWRANLDRAGQEAPLATEGLAWDAPNYTPPGFNAGTPPVVTLQAGGAMAPQLSSGTPTSRYMVGSIALGVVMVSGNSPAFAFTQAEKTKILEQVQKGANFLATAEPRARVSFVYDVRDITVTTNQGPYTGASDYYEYYEKGWRDDALGQLGYSPGRAGYQAYAQDLRATNNTDWSYVAFFTKYQLYHFAYAVFEKLVMQYDNDNWGPDNIHRVFAHESCHIFGASDEYGSCICGERSGELLAPNNNCVRCPGLVQVPCLMNANTLTFCKWSKQQIGWDDSLFPK